MILKLSLLKKSTPNFFLLNKSNHNLFFFIKYCPEKVKVRFTRKGSTSVGEFLDFFFECVLRACVKLVTEFGALKPSYAVGVDMNLY